MSKQRTLFVTSLIITLVICAAAPAIDGAKAIKISGGEDHTLIRNHSQFFGD